MLQPVHREKAEREATPVMVLTAALHPLQAATAKIIVQEARAEQYKQAELRANQAG